MPAQRALTDGEIADLLVRHPLAAAEIIATKAAMLVLTPDQIVSPPTWYQIDVPGLIPPWGIAIQDSQYGVVVVHWDASMIWHYDGWTAVDPNFFDEGMIYSPVDPNQCDLLCQAQNVSGTIQFVAIGFLLWAILKGRS